MVSPGYFQTFGIHIDRGRSFTEDDSAGGVPVAVVNEAFAGKYFAGVDPVRQTIVVEQLIPGVTKLGPSIPSADRGRLPRRPQLGPERRRFPRNRRALRSESVAASDHCGTRVR